MANNNNVNNTEFNVQDFIQNHVPTHYTRNNTYGMWHVVMNSPEGYKDYGVWEGFIDEIALTINCNYYALQFTPCVIQTPKSIDDIPTGTTSNICIDFKGEYQILFDNKIRVIKEIFANRPVNISSKNGYIEIRKPGTKQEEDKIKLQNILDKLTDEEKEFLGYNV